MIPEPQSQAPGPRSAKLRIVAPIAIVVAGLAVFLALFWHQGGHHGRKGQRHPGSSADRDRSPVGGSGESNRRVTGGGGSPVGGGPSRSGSGGKGDTWWYRDGKSRREAPNDAWWAPKKDGRGNGAAEGSDDRSPVGGSDAGDRSGTTDRTREDDAPARSADRPARASTTNPGEAAGQKGGPDDFWWRN